MRERLLREPYDDVAPAIPIRIEQLDETQLGEYNAFRNPPDTDAARRRLAAGDKCFIARHEGRIVGCCWSATGRAWSVYLSRWITLSSDEVYQYDSFVAKEFRGQRIFPALTREMQRFCRLQGKRRIISLVVPENRSAMHSDSGFRTIGTMGFVGFGRFRREFTHLEPGALAPGETARSTSRWDRDFAALDAREHYLDSFLAELKRKAYLNLIERWGGVPSAGCVLKTDLFEEAMGPDAFLLDLAGSRQLLVGMDLSSSAAMRACERDSVRRAQYLVGDARALPFASGSIDLIVSPSTLDHFPESSDLHKSLRELTRVLAPTGRLIITLDNRQNIFDLLLRGVNRAGLVPFYLGRSYSVNELRSELEAAGLDVLETTAIVHHPRLTAVAAVAAARSVDWPPLTRLVHSTFRTMQRLQGTRLELYSGCFVAALAVPRVRSVA